MTNKTIKDKTLKAFIKQFMADTLTIHKNMILEALPKEKDMISMEMLSLGSEGFERQQTYNQCLSEVKHIIENI